MATKSSSSLPASALSGAGGPAPQYLKVKTHLREGIAGGRWRPGAGAEQKKPEERKVFNAERKALQVMGLEAGATLEVVKAKYKLLVKQHHPDANGGDRSTEDRLVEVIQSDNYLKSVGFA